MKIHKSTYQQMDELFKEARQDKPVMNLKEVEKIVHTGEYIPAGGIIRRFHVGVNTLIVVSGIVVSSLLTYFTLRENHANTEAPKPVVTNTVQQAPPVQNTVQVPQQTASVDTKPHAEPVLKKADKERPAAKPENFVASTDNKVAVDNTIADTKQDESEITAPVEAKPEPVNSKMFIVGFAVQIQDVNGDIYDMKLNGDDVTMLSKNDQIIPKESYGDYEEVINAGKVRASGKTVSKGDNSSMELISFLDSQLHSDKILEGDAHYTFELSSSQLLINKEAQDKAVFKKYKKFYEEKTGQPVTKGSVYRFEKGTKAESE